jgi:hypothetical protein
MGIIEYKVTPGNVRFKIFNRNPSGVPDQDETIELTYDGHTRVLEKDSPPGPIDEGTKEDLYRAELYWIPQLNVWVGFVDVALEESNLSYSYYTSGPYLFPMLPPPSGDEVTHIGVWRLVRLIGRERDRFLRMTQLKQAAAKYFDALTRKDFNLIPYDDNVSLRTSLAPGGVLKALVGRENLRSVWWTPLTSILGEVRILDFYYNEKLTAVVGEAEVEVTKPRSWLRLADRFTINSAGKIIEQVNHFDPHDATKVA